VRSRFGSDSILAQVGETPLVRLNRVTRGLPPAVSIYAKLELYNASGSVKARPALWMIWRGLESGELVPGKTILDSTSGNTGIALAMTGAALGYPVELVMAANASEERKKILKAYGANVILSDPHEGSDGAILLCREIYAKNPDKYFRPDQYRNHANPQAHYDTTGPEIWRQTGGRVTHVVATLGTGGTATGTGRYFRDHHPEVRVIAVEPSDGFHGIEGLKHMESSIVPETFDPESFHETRPAETEDAYDMARRLVREEGMMVGQSCGAAVHKALELAKTLDRGFIVCILADSGERYLSTALWSDL